MPPPRLRATLPTILVLAVAASCGGGEGPPSPEPGFPADYVDSFVEVRDCRTSGDHELHEVRILANDLAAGPYLDRAGEFPDGAVIVKEEREYGDEACAGPILEWTVMIKDAAHEDQLGWHWQRVDVDREVIEQDLPSCSGCHGSDECVEVGFGGTCADE